MCSKKSPSTPPEEEQRKMSPLPLVNPIENPEGVEVPEFIQLERFILLVAPEQGRFYVKVQRSFQFVNGCRTVLCYMHYAK